NCQFDKARLKTKMSSTEKIITIENMRNDSRTPRLAIIFAAEFFGTATLLFVGCMGVCTSRFILNIALSPKFGDLGFGFAVLLSIQSIGHISGAHLNPQVSLAALINGHIRLVEIPFYLLGEFTGAIAGFGLLMLLWPAGSHPECSTRIHSDITVLQAIGMEVTITALLIIACCAAWDSRNESNTDSTAIRLGLVISVLSMGAGPITGSSMNTARSFAPALLGNVWRNHWVYWVGPTLGSCIGSVFYKYVLGYQVK
ncbi:hypothetical protein RN001_007695, partial [Aquatica leii]